MESEAHTRVRKRARDLPLVIFGTHWYSLKIIGRAPMVAAGPDLAEVYQSLNRATTEPTTGPGLTEVLQSLAEL